MEMQLDHQLTDINGLREQLFSPDSAPSIRWLRARVADRTIPSVKIGRLVYFSPDAVREALAKRTRKASR